MNVVNYIHACLIGSLAGMAACGCTAGKIFQPGTSPPAAMEGSPVAAWPSLASTGPATSPAAAMRDSPVAPASVAPGEAPSVYGSRLHIAPGATASERALELTEKLATIEAEKAAITSRVRELETTLAAKDKALTEATAHITEARTELTRSRTELERWKQEMAGLRVQLRDADKENFTTLQTTVSLLKQLLSREDQSEAAAQ